MSRASIVAATRGLKRSALYGIASCKAGGETTDFEIGWEEFNRDTDWAEALLAASGIVSGDFVMVTAPNWEGPWSSPFVHALRRIGAVYMPVEHFAWDARRAAHFLEVLKPKAFLGLGGETLSGIRGLGVDIGPLLSEIEVIWARLDARDALSEFGAQAEDFVPLGPAVAVGVPGIGTVVNTAEWQVTSANGELLVSTASRRASSFTNLRTGIQGTMGTHTDWGVRVDFSR